jgi:hypothetical protein
MGSNVGMNDQRSALLGRRVIDSQGSNNEHLGK